MRTRGHMLAMLAAAMSAHTPLSAQKRIERPLAFDPLAMLRRPPRKERQRSGAGAHSSGRQAERYARQGAGINVHFEKRMRWNAEVYPRVLEHQAKQRERSGR